MERAVCTVGCSQTVDRMFAVTVNTVEVGNDLVVEQRQVAAP